MNAEVRARGLEAESAVQNLIPGAILNITLVMGPSGNPQEYSPVDGLCVSAFADCPKRTGDAARLAPGIRTEEVVWN